MQTSLQSDERAVWGSYPNYDDEARFEYGRRFWRLPEMRARLLAHWLDERHPYRDRFLERRALLEEVLTSPNTPVELDAELRRRGTSLRCVAREIPPVFGSFFEVLDHEGATRVLCSAANPDAVLAVCRGLL